MTAFPKIAKQPTECQYQKSGTNASEATFRFTNYVSTTRVIEEEDTPKIENRTCVCDAVHGDNDNELEYQIFDT